MKGKIKHYNMKNGPVFTSYKMKNGPVFTSYNMKNGPVFTSYCVTPSDSTMITERCSATEMWSAPKGSAQTTESMGRKHIRPVENICVDARRAKINNRQSRKDPN